MLADCIRLAQTNNEALEALLQKFAPLIKKCGRQLHIEDGNEEMILAFIELVKDFSPSNLRNIDDGTVVQYIKRNRQISLRIKRPPSQRISNEMAVNIFIMV